MHIVKHTIGVSTETLAAGTQVSVRPFGSDGSMEIILHGDAWYEVVLDAATMREIKEFLAIMARPRDADEARKVSGSGSMRIRKVHATIFSDDETYCGLPVVDELPDKSKGKRVHRSNTTPCLDDITCELCKRQIFV